MGGGLNFNYCNLQYTGMATRVPRYRYRSRRSLLSIVAWNLGNCKIGQHHQKQANFAIYIAILYSMACSMVPYLVPIPTRGGIVGLVHSTWHACRQRVPTHNLRMGTVQPHNRFALCVSNYTNHPPMHSVSCRAGPYSCGVSKMQDLRGGQSGLGVSANPWSFGN